MPRRVPETARPTARRTRRRRAIGPVLAVVVALVGTTGCTTDEETETTSIAVWPAAPTGFPSPESAARDFVDRVLGVTPRTGPFMAGDSMSGEIEVYIGEDLPGIPEVSKGTLILRRIDGHGWFVTAAANRFNTIDSPTDRARVPAGTLSVTGRARGFEGQVSIVAYLPAGTTDAGAPVVVDSVSTIAGSGATPEPFAVSLDLSSVEPESVVAILLRGGRGLEQDPGEFTAIPVVVGPVS